MDLLLTEDWDLLDDGNGSIALTPSQEYSVAQTVATEIKLFEGEGWYDQSQGTPHFALILGVNPNYPLIRQVLLWRATGVDGVRNADMDMYIDQNRTLRGDIFVTTGLKGNIYRVQY
ncbi:unnamed protein product [Commensalibacter communis]|uniref:Uncharacterized protein n=1 Tax=Commensalibacter communis TaxID=2972786 RepID=A0A9W4X7N2_9PROT|nr:hypothetical protein [Commensalibacter communis]CAI3941463.1 unnamed protein product [Commensalibacter communis]CAI3945164.1 unnamed protein product [Commensalibacter communis]CAI3959316.1 unnamed protein product [Commensalibacter communis]CAI3960773.1 unnamed protein product [Commensalibacter communis]